MRRIIADPSSRSTQRAAAKRRLFELTGTCPIDGADPERAYVYYRRFYRKRFDALFAIFVNESERPERREAARLRLKYF